MTTDETKVDLDAVFVIAGEVGAEKIQQNSGRVSFEFPWGIAAALVPVILLAALGAAILPAESAVRGSLVEALEYE